MKEGALAECPLPASDAIALPPRSPAPTTGAGACVRCEGLGVRSMDGRDLVRGLSLRVRRGERLLVVGRNGAGKSTLLRAIAGLVPPTTGRVDLDLGPTTGRPGAVGLLAQRPQRNLFEHTVADELAFSLRRRGVGRAARARRVAETLALCDLAPLHDRSPLRLSLGEQHRVALAAMLAPEPALVLLDEPFFGLDREARERMLEVLTREQQRTGMTLVVASHDREPLAGWAHRCLELGPEVPADA
jgi:energy-coupling factor transport system ATP-binding protein